MYWCGISFKTWKMQGAEQYVWNATMCVPKGEGGIYPQVSLHIKTGKGKNIYRSAFICTLSLGRYTKKTHPLRAYQILHYREHLLWFLLYSSVRRSDRCTPGCSGTYWAAPWGVESPWHPGVEGKESTETRSLGIVNASKKLFLRAGTYANFLS